MTPLGRVLVIEDETSLADALAEGLRQDGFEAETIADGLLGLDAGLTRPFDAIVLDLMLPSLPGLELCAQLRRAGIRVPVLVLTARNGELDQLRALRIGADDFLTKPFSYRVLLARLHALLRRSGLRRADVLTAGDLALDRVARRCRRGETAIELTPREFALLELLMSRPGQVVSKQFALGEVWDSAIPIQSNVLEVYVAYLRRKIDLPFGKHAVETVRGAGYRLAADGG
jgi:DNA-binding response OmpR family regulator